METRNLIYGVVLAFGVYLIASYAVRLLSPPHPQPAGPQSPPAAMPGAPGAPPAAPPAAPGGTPPSSAPNAATNPAGLSVAVGPAAETFTRGGEADDLLSVTFDPRGASIASVRLTDRVKSGKFAYRMTPRGKDAYELLSPVDGRDGPMNSFLTRSLWITEQGNASWRLDDVSWQVIEPTADAGPRSAAFATTLKRDDGSEVLRLAKSFRFSAGSRLIQMDLEIENRGGEPLTIAVEQLGPLGIPFEDVGRKTRHLIAGRMADQSLKADAVTRTDLQKHGTRKLFSPSATDRFLWLALTNKYFGAFVRPLPVNGAPLALAGVESELAAPQLSDSGDLLGRIVTAWVRIAPGEKHSYPFEIYAGPKEPEMLAKANPDFVDRTKLGYVAAHDADFSCMCTFHPLPEIMTWLLRTLAWVVRNYGLAIIALVFIVRGALHPLTVFQQKSMYRMQDAMGRIQPKMDAIKAQFANDKVRQQQEMMKLWSEENVNPAGSVVAMVPLFIQMPILAALYVALSGDLHLRHAPFDGYWIRDLAAPDALVNFGDPGINVPLLSWIMGPIHSLNVLPLLMGVSMFLQQKYMPKPRHLAKQLAARQQQQHQKASTPGAMSPEDQLRQQQMMGNMMAIMFPVMFYTMPAGLNLYWFTTNIFGIGESLIIRRQLEAEHDRREREGPRPPQKKKPGMLARMMRKLAEEAEHLQKKADEMSEHKGAKKKV
ncbi:MAG: membrane protein insertase YidC [Phycisphaerae bacterium]